MRNRISIIIIMVSFFVLLYTAIYGIHIGTLNILSVSELMQKNDTLNAKIEQSQNIIETTYSQNVKTLEKTFDNYKVQKQKYEDLQGLIEEKEDELYETKQYDVGYIWRILGTYASNRNINLGINIQKDTLTKKTYNIIFNMSGKYTDISQFITDIENDSNLYFRIYDFDMREVEVKVKDEDGKEKTITYLTASFVVRNVNLDSNTIIQE